MSYPFCRNHLSAPGLLSEARRCFEQIPDNTGNAIPLADHLMSGMALFGFKYPSLLQFDQESRNEITRANLKSLYGIERVPSYLAKRFPKRLRLFPNPKRQRAEELVLGMRTLRFRPLLLAYIDHILAADRAGTREWNPYTLYEALIETWLAREEGKLRKQLENPPNRETLWEICATVAVALQRQSKRELSRAALDTLVECFPQVRDIEHFDMGGRSLLNRNADGAFRFSHYSIQEFLVAHGLLAGRTGDSTAALDKIRVTGQLLEFLVVSGREIALDFSILEGLNARKQPLPKLHFHDRLPDGSRGPLMQWIPAGEFLMGSPKDEKEHSDDEGPQHEVRIAAPFALGTTPVTFAEYDRFCAATGREKPEDEGWGRERRPVIHVCWQDALDYCDWLSRETGQHYRLPSEAEWEYAARAGTRTRYWWGDEIEKNRAHCASCGSQWDRKRTAPVGSFKPNPFGLFDTAGNVWEWTLDCWHGDYRGALTDGSPWGQENGGDGFRRVLRGGSWSSGPGRLRSAGRGRFYPVLWLNHIGFRLARAL